MQAHGAREIESSTNLIHHRRESLIMMVNRTDANRASRTKNVLHLILVTLRYQKNVPEMLMET